MRNFLFLFITILAAGSLEGCSSGNVEVLQNKFEAAPQNIKSLPSKNGQIFVKDDGWEIPGLASGKKLESYSRKVNVKGGKNITFSITDFDPKIGETEEPFKSIGEDLGLIHIGALKEFAIDGQKFCYKVQANRVGHGSLFPFAYYDEDGDGKFESLILDEKDYLEIDGKEIELISFASLPHVPEWLQKVND